MKLVYDIAVMAQLVAACQSANTEIVKAEQLVQQVRSHSDWTCKEKSVIDELMQECKGLVQRMREDQGSFLRVLKEVEGELNQTENSVSNLFSSVESILGKVLAIPVAQSVATGAGLLGAGSAIGSIGNKIGDVLKNIVDSGSDVILPNTTGIGWADDLLEKMKDIGSGITDAGVIWQGPGLIGVSVGEVLENPWVRARKENPNVNGIGDISSIADIGVDIGVDVPKNADQIITDITNVIGTTWNVLQDSPLGDVVGDAMRSITESIAICDMGNLVL